MRDVEEPRVLLEEALMNRAFCIVWLAGCGAATGPSQPDAHVAMVTSVDVTPSTKILKRGLDAPTQLIAIATLDDGRTADVTASATWESSAAAVVKVDGGLISPVGFGSATITATYEGQRDSAMITSTSPRVYMTNTGVTPTILVFDAFATGDIPPLQKIVLPTSAPSSFPWAIQVVEDEIYLSDPTRRTVSVWPITANGAVAPTRVIPGTATTKLNGNYGLVVANHEIYTVGASTTSQPEIVVFPATANGDVAPTREIVGDVTLLGNDIETLAVYMNELYVVNTSAQQILVFPLTASGNVAPTRTLTLPVSPYDVKFADGEMYIADLTGIRVYLATASGMDNPIRYIVGPDTGLTNVIGVSIVGHELFSVNYTGTGGLHVHSRSATSDAVPLRNIPSGGMTTISSPRYQDVY
ncbi:MAG: hypothetical protein ABI678_06020 [Kofleriaceae bacterium]